jgi:cation diffusion facilitator family transporter
LVFGGKVATEIFATVNTQETKSRQRRADQVVNLGLGVNILLAIAKLFAGIVGHSQALLADGVNSTSDVIYYIVIKIFVKLSGKPADKEHPYGHYQFESIAAVVVGAFVITTGIAIFWDSINAAFDLMSGKTDVQTVKFYALWVALATVVIKIFLMINASIVARKTKNIAISALAKDHRNDIFASLGAAVGISLGLFGMPWFDPIAGAIVAVLVAKTGFGILQESAADLMDSVPSTPMENEIRGLIDDIERVIAVEEVHAHRFGPYFSVNITIGIDGKLSVSEGDRIADLVEQRLIEKMKMVRRIYVHYHPANAPSDATSVVA